MDIKIRRAESTDSKTVNDFLTKLIHDEKQYDNNVNEKCIVSRYYEEKITDTTNCILLAENNGVAVGYLYGYIEDIGDAYIESIAVLDAMYVDDNYRNNGIGNILIEKFEEFARNNNVKYIELKVCNGNHKAISMYKKNGFKDTKSVMMKLI